MANAQLDRVGEFFDYFEEARALKVQGGEQQELLGDLYRGGEYWTDGAPLDELKTVQSAIMSRLKFQADAGIGANNLHVLRTDEETALLQDNLSDRAKEVVGARDDIYARLAGLRTEATERYAGSLVVVKALGDTRNFSTMHRVIHEGQSSGEYRNADSVKGLIANIDIADFGLSLRGGQLTVEKHGLVGGVKRFRVTVMQPVPVLWNGYAPPALQRGVDIRFLEK